MVKVQYCEKQFGRYFGGNKSGYSVNFIDSKENFIGIDQDSTDDDNCIFLVDVELAIKYKSIYNENSCELEHGYEKELEKGCIKKENYLEIEELLIDEEILNGSINVVSEGVCYFELTGDLAILFIGNEDTDEYTGGETHKQMYSCYNKVLTIFDKIENKKDI